LRSNSQDCGGPAPITLVVSAQGAPDERTDSSFWNVAELSRPALLDRLRSVGVADEAVLTNDELMDLLEPMIRADIALADSYRYRPSPPLNVPIAAIGDVDDDERRYVALSGWRRHTVDGFALRLLPGSHGYGVESWLRVGQAVMTELAQHAACGKEGSAW